MSTLELFSPLIREWFSTRFECPTPIQEAAWPRIAAGKHVLLTAPTGTGKTLTAFLSALDKLLTGQWETGGLRVLYVSPLKALGNDIRRNLLSPLEEIRELAERNGIEIPAIDVLIRSGDTPQRDRRRMIGRPPEILITTPESLNLILASPRARTICTGIRTVILDEIHAVVGSKRGTHLITAVDRLVLVAGEFQRVAVSATVRPMETVAAFVGGFIHAPGQASGVDTIPRHVDTVEVPGGKKYDVMVEFLSSEMHDSDTFWEAVATRLKPRIAEIRSTLVFVNARQHAEKLAFYINEGEPAIVAYAHHGSLSREIRHLVERKLKAGELKAIVATSSLEMGIDIGDLDAVVLVQSPFSVSSAVQRIGRAGHRVGEISRGVVYPSHGRDILDAALTIRMALAGDIEPVRPVEAPLDVLAQIIIAMTGVEPWNIEDLYRFFLTSFPYRSLTREAFDSVLHMLEGRFEQTRIPELKARVSVDRISGTVTARKGALYLVYSAGGTIPDRGYYGLYVQGTGDKVGELDEEFVWERRLGQSFTLGTQSWKITRIDHHKVEVVPWSGGISSMTFWKADRVNRDYHYSERLTELLEEFDGRADSAGFAAELADEYPLDTSGAEALAGFLKLQKKVSGTALPHRRHVVAEETGDPAGGKELRLLFYHTLWGGRINKPLELALAALAAGRGIMVDTYSDNDCILLLSPQEIDPNLLFELSGRAGRETGDESLSALIRLSLDKSGFFGARFRENAGRALLLPRSGPGKRVPLWLTRLRAKALLDAVKGFSDFPILYETWRECLRDEFDMESLQSLLEEIRLGAIEISVVRTGAPSPFTSGLRWQHTNKYMYMDDTPESGKDSAIDEATVKELVLSGELKPEISSEVHRRFLAKLHRTAPGYAPEEAVDLLDFVKDRCLIPFTEWTELLEAIRGDLSDREPSDVGGDDGDTTATGDAGAADESFDEMLGEVADRLVSVRVPASGVTFVAATERLPFILAALDIAPETNLKKIFDQEEPILDAVQTACEFLRRSEPIEADESDLLAEWLKYYGPVEYSEVSSLFGPGICEAVEILLDEEVVLVDSLLSGGVRQVCDADNLERLLYFNRSETRPGLTARPVEELQPFLAGWQGLGKTGESEEDLAWCLDKLIGYPARAPLWESEILPARLSNYSSSWLDTLLRETDLEWFGCGKQIVAFRFEGDEHLYAPEPETGLEAPGLLPSQMGRYGFREVRAHTGLDSEDLVVAMLETLWQGGVLCDSFGVVRRFGSKSPKKGSRSSTRTPDAGGGLRFNDFAGVRLKRPANRGHRRQRRQPLEGGWYTPPPVEERDPLELLEDAKDRVRQLLSRYGILFRELLRHELPSMRWSRVFKALRIMELSGEVYSGQFFEGIHGAQFISRSALAYLRQGTRSNQMFRLNAADPASLCGVPIPGLSGRLPPRVPSTHLFYKGERLLMTAKRNFRELAIHLPPGDPELPLSSITQPGDGRTRIRIEIINGETVDTSPYLEDFLSAGFRRGYRTLMPETRSPA